MAQYGLEMVAVFVGLESRDGWDCFAWQITLTRGGRSFTTPYRLGLGHAKRVETAPASSKIPRVPMTAELARKLSNGRKVTISDTEGYLLPNVPTLADVLPSLQSDARSGEHLLFEDFASEYGYDTDSRKAEKLWRMCQEIRGQLQKLLGADFEAFMQQEEEDFSTAE